MHSNEYQRAYGKYAIITCFAASYSTALSVDPNLWLWHRTPCVAMAKSELTIQSTRVTINTQIAVEPRWSIPTRLDLWPQQPPQTPLGHARTSGQRGHKTIRFLDERVRNGWKSVQIMVLYSFALWGSGVRISSGPPYKTDHFDTKVSEWSVFIFTIFRIYDTIS